MGFDPAKFICNALAPCGDCEKSLVSRGARQSMEMVVPTNQLSLAIGKRGQNVRLASKLSGMASGCTSESNLQPSSERDLRLSAPAGGSGRKDGVALLTREGSGSADELGRCTGADLMQLAVSARKRRAKIIESASELVRR